MMHAGNLYKNSWAIGLALAVISAPGTGYAQSSSDRVTDLERKLERSLQGMAELQRQLEGSLKVIDGLSARVKQLEAAAPKTEDAAKQSARIETVEQQVSQIASASAMRSNEDSGLPMHGFVDVGAGTNNRGTNKGFTVGSLDFYLAPQLGDRVKTLVELNVEVDNEGGIGVDLERAQIGYTFSDAATVWLGRFHTPYGYYNTAFHHGQQIATAARRPRFLEFEDKGGIVPAHTTGLWTTGYTRTGGGKVTYDVFVGNSPSITEGTLNMNQAGMKNYNGDFGANLGYAFGGGLDGLKLGGHYYHARVSDDQVPVNTTDVNFWGGYAVYDTDRWEHMAEFYRFDNKDASGGTGSRKSNAAYVQLAYRAVTGWTPYARFERTSLDQNDSYFAQQASGVSYTRQALGLRYDLNVKSALKVELAHTRENDRSLTSYNEAMLQYAIRF